MQLIHRADAEQVMVQAGIAEIELRPLDLALAQVLVPGPQLADQEELLQQVQVPADGRLADLQRVRQLGDVDDLTVVMGEHGQQPVNRRRRQLGTKLRQVPLHEGAEERTPPCRAVGLARGQKRTRESAPAPQVGQSVRADLDRLKSGELDVLDPPGERLGRLTQQVRPGAAEDQKPEPVIPVDQDPQDREQFTPALDFIDNDCARNGLQRRHGLVQTSQVERVFEVEVAGRVGGHDLPRQGGLPALPRSHDGDDRCADQRPSYRPQCRASNHALSIP